MGKRTYYYARVSTKEQSLERQIAAFKEMGADDREIIIDKQSGKILDRPGYSALRTIMLREGDTLVIKSLDRLSRNKSDIKTELKYFKDNGIRVKVIDLPTTMVDVPDGQEWMLDMVNNILIEVLASMAEQERENILQRQKEGIAIAKAGGKYKGKPKMDIDRKRFEEVAKRWRAGEITATAGMKELGVKPNTWYRRVKEWGL